MVNWFSVLGETELAIGEIHIHGHREMHRREGLFTQGAEIRIQQRTAAGRACPTVVGTGQHEVFILQALEEHIDDIIVRPVGFGGLGLDNADLEVHWDTCGRLLPRRHFLGAGQQSHRYRQAKKE